MTKPKANSEVAQVEAALRRIRRNEADARACSWVDAGERGLYLLKKYQENGTKDVVDSVAVELLEKYGAREYTRTEIATVIEGRQQLPAPGAELVKRASRLGGVQRDILRDIAKFDAVKASSSHRSGFFYRPEQLGGAREKRIEELMKLPESLERNAEIRRLARRLPKDFTGKAGVYRVGDRKIAKADFLRAMSRLEALGLVNAYLMPKSGAPDRSYFFGVELRHRYSLDPSRRQREYAWSLTTEGQVLAYAVLHAEPWHPGLLAEFCGRLGWRQRDRLGVEPAGLSAVEETANMVRHAAGRIALERRGKQLRTAGERADHGAVAENRSVSH